MKSSFDDKKREKAVKASASEKSFKLNVDLTGSDKEEEMQAVAFSFDHSVCLSTGTTKSALQSANTTYCKMATITQAALMLPCRL